MKSILSYAVTQIAPLISILAALASGGEPDSVATRKAQKYAMLVGINGYSKPLGNLEYCQNDITDLRRHLCALGFSEEHTVVMRDGASESRYLPSKANIVKELDLLLAMANEEDLVLIAFSGHGLHVEGTSYLCPFDAKIDHAAETMLSLDELYRRLQGCRAAQKVLIVDACRNEPLTKGFRAPGGLKGFADDLKQPPKGVWLLTSCGPGQWSAEDPTLKHGVFMHYTLEGLKGRADQECAGNRDGKVTLDELFHYANQKTMNHVRRSHGIVQKPMREGSADGDYVISQVSKVLEPSVLEEVIRKENETMPVDPTLGATAGTRSGTLDHPLLTQADTYLRQVDYGNAITAYSAIIEDSHLPIDLRRKARKGRSAAYLGRGSKSDLDKAIIDQQAAGSAGIHLIIRAKSSPLQIETEKKGEVFQSEVVLVTLSDGNWLWVNSVNGDATRQGYIVKDAVIAEQAGTPSASQADAAATTANQGYSYPDGYDNDAEESTPAMRTAEKNLNRLYDRYDRTPTPALEGQIDAAERRYERMRGR